MIITQDFDNPAAIEAFFRSSSVELTQALIDALSASQATRALPTTNQSREYWASVLFARLCGFAASIHKLIPGTPANPAGSTYDFGSVATLWRSLFEAHLAMHYLCAPTLLVEDYTLRLRLIQLHDCTRRPEILKKMEGSPDEDWFSQQATELRSDITSNPIFQLFEPRRQAELLKGKTPYYLNQDELVAQIFDHVTQMRGVYEFLSSQTHSFPFSYWKVPFHKDRGTGRENIVEKGYIAAAAQMAKLILEIATSDMQEIFQMVPTFPRCAIEWDSLTCRAIPEGEFIIGMRNPCP